jgi:lipopolysaccharide transport system ATP-binding protein
MSSSQVESAGLAAVVEAPIPSTSPVSAQNLNAPTSDELVVSVRDVGKCYEMYGKPLDRLKQTLWRGKRQFYREFWALRHIWFDVRRGESMGIIGRNGSGKSTLLQIIAGTVRPTEGEVAVGGRVAALLELGSGFNPEFTGRENVFMNGAILGIPQADMQSRMDEILAFADIGQFIDQPVKTYSSGMYLRLAFSVATTVDPDILIVDEALAVGDLLFQHKCMNRIRRMCDSGTTLLFVSHDPDSVRALCRRCIWLDQGQAAMSGAAREVADAYMRSFAIERNAQVLEQQSPSSSDEEFFSPSDAAVQTLDGADVLAVENIRLLNARGEPTEALLPNERFTIECTLRPQRDLHHISVGFVIKNRHGVELTGESVFNARRRGLSLTAGQTRVVRFSATNNLRGGDYAVAVRAHYVKRWDRADAVTLYANEVALVFHVVYDPEQPMWFNCRYPFEVSVS